MINKVFLLGLLRSQKLHGYGVVEYLNNHGTGGAAIGKSNAYRLLRVMESDGLIESVTEREGNRPERHVYAVTPAGEDYFREQLLVELGNDATAGMAGIAVLNYLDELDPAAAAERLEVRRDKVAARYAELEHVPKDVIDVHAALDLERQLTALELGWLDEPTDRGSAHACAMSRSSRRSSLTSSRNRAAYSNLSSAAA